MAEIRFNFSLLSKPKVKNGHKIKIIEKDVLGVIHINLNGSYSIIIDNIRYLLTGDSYKLKDKNVYYATTLCNKHTLKIITLDKTVRQIKGYLPFYVGAVCKGNIIMEQGIRKFKLKKIIELKDLDESLYMRFNKLSHDAKAYYRDNYDEICRTD